MPEQTGVFYQRMVPLRDADCILVGFPFDGTVSARPGARFGPRAARESTLHSEDYSPYLNRDIARLKIYDAGDIELPLGDTGAALAMIGKTYARLSKPGGVVVALGGEHLVTLPAIETLYKKWGDRLFVVQFDAHADLREEYLGVEMSHATVMHRIAALIGRENTAAVGIRSGTVKEWRILRSHPHCFSDTTARAIDDFIPFAERELRGRKVYVTLDLDVFDPSVMPGTGTPEPGGIDFRRFMRLLKSLASCDIVGADIVELAPDYDNSGISSALAATVLREIMLLSGGTDE
jgi:agmatinase